MKCYIIKDLTDDAVYSVKFDSHEDALSAIPDLSYELDVDERDLCVVQVLMVGA